MTYEQFWARYLRAHSKPSTRVLHYIGSLLAISLLAAGIVLLDWRLIVAAPVVGYGFAWTAHVALEGNRPETFGHPLWSLVSDYRMLFLWLTGRLGTHLAASGVGEAAPRG